MQIIKRLLKKYKELSPVAKTSIAMIFVKFFQKGLMLISGPIFTRIMPSAEYGIISTFTSWQNVLSVLFTLNLSQGVFNNGMHEFKRDRNSFIFSMLMLSNVCTIMGITIFVIFKKWLYPFLELPTILIFIMFVYFLVTPAYNFWIARNRYEYKYVLVATLSVFSSIFMTVAAIIAVLNVSDGNKAIIKVVSTETVSIIISIVIYIYICISSKAKIEFKYWKYALSINLPLVPHYLSMYILSASDRIMITKLINTSATAIYNVAYTVAAVTLIFWNAVDSSYAPWIYQKLEERDYKSLQKRANEVIILFAGCATFITLFAPEIIRILGPEEYYEGVYIIPSVMAGVYFTAIFSLYMRIELYLKKTSVIMFATILSACSNVLLNYIFIPIYGYMAAGYTTLVCYMLLAVFHAFNLKKLGYGSVYNNKVIIVISVVVLFITFFMPILYSYTVLRYIMIIFLFGVGMKNRKALIRLLKKAK